MTYIHPPESESESDTDFIAPILMKADLSHILPFWLRVIPEPSSPSSRHDEYRRLADALEHVPSGHADSGLPYSWEVERLSWYGGEPDRIANMQLYRIRARVCSDWFKAKWKALLVEFGHSNIIVEAESRHRDASSFRYEEFGLGSLEYVIRFTAFDWTNWLAFLGDEQLWVTAFERLNKLIDSGALPIQEQWPILQTHFADACNKVNIKRFVELEKLRDVVSLKPPPSPGGPQSKRLDDLCWTYTSILILFRNPNAPDHKALIELICLIFASWNGTAPTHLGDKEHSTDRNPAGEPTLTSPFIATGAGSLDIIVAQNMGLLAVVTELSGHSSESSNAPSRRVRAIWRQLQMNYAAITEATYGVQKFIEDAVRTRSSVSSHTQAASTFERLRRTTAALSLIRFRTMLQNYEADDFEPAVYFPGHRSWEISEADAVLKEMLDEADRATARLNDLVVQKADRRLSVLVAGLAAITLLGVLHDVAQFAGSGDPVGLPNTLSGWLRLSILIVTAVVAGAAVFWTVRIGRTTE